MPANVVRTAEDERHWREAKRQAEKQGRKGDYAYVMGIFQRMSGKKSFCASVSGKRPLADRIHDLVKARRRALAGQLTLPGIPGQTTLFGDAPRGRGATDKPPPGFQPVKGSKRGGHVKIVYGQKGKSARRIASTADALAWLEANHGKEVDRDKEMAARRKAGLIVQGDTYPFRKQISDAGGMWDRLKEQWLMPDRESLDRVHQAMRGKPPREEPKRAQPATPKQINYALDLLDRLRRDDYGTFTTYGYQGVNRRDVEKMSRSDVSAMIDHIRSELY